MLSDNLVSVIMPSYNSGEFIKDAINSVLMQTYTSWEMIIVDDCSNDDSVKIIEQAIKNNPKIRLIRLAGNTGAAMARNIALEASNGRFIAFLDSDDIWYIDKLEKQVSFMLKSEAPISFTSYNLIDKDGNSKNHIIHSVEKLNQLDYLKNTIIGFSTSMIDTKHTGRDFRLTNIRTRQDTSLWITLLGEGFTAHGMTDTLVDYRVHFNSISANKYKSAKQVWNLYFNIHKLGFLKSLYCFIFYLYNAIIKRI
jgi:teichuronic acid biosynthesis glycosyltransferase TuaG